MRLPRNHRRHVCRCSRSARNVRQEGGGGGGGGVVSGRVVYGTHTHSLVHLLLAGSRQGCRRIPQCAAHQKNRSSNRSETTIWALYVLARFRKKKSERVFGFRDAIASDFAQLAVDVKSASRVRQNTKTHPCPVAAHVVVIATELRFSTPRRIPAWAAPPR
jgi:hypothetical protein